MDGVEQGRGRDLGGLLSCTRISRRAAAHKRSARHHGMAIVRHDGRGFQWPLPVSIGGSKAVVMYVVL